MFDFRHGGIWRGWGPSWWWMVDALKIKRSTWISVSFLDIRFWVSFLWLFPFSFRFSFSLFAFSLFLVWIVRLGLHGADHIDVPDVRFVRQIYEETKKHPGNRRTREAMQDNNILDEEECGMGDLGIILLNRWHRSLTRWTCRHKRGTEENDNEIRASKTGSFRHHIKRKETSSRNHKSGKTGRARTMSSN